jgi:hypothetical protein
MPLREMGPSARCIRATRVAAVALGIAALGLAAPREGRSEAPAVGPERVERIARKVERIRDLEFRQLPRVARIRPGLMRDRYGWQAGWLRQEMMRLLGYLDPRESLAEAVGAPAAVYVARRNLVLVHARVPITDLLLVHELLHALEAQALGLRAEWDDGDERALAGSALREGTAMLVEESYARRNDLMDRYLIETFFRDPLMEIDLRYGQGMDFAKALRAQPSGWRYVDEALRGAPPLTTHEVMHPHVYLQRRGSGDSVAAPLRARLDLPAGWRLAGGRAAGAFEAWRILEKADQEQILETHDAPPPQDLTEGWRGGTLELWRTGPLRSEACPSPCRRRSLLLLGLRWEDANAARQFQSRALGFPEYLGLLREGRGLWGHHPRKHIAASLARKGSYTWLALAPDTHMARRATATAEPE